MEEIWKDVVGYEGLYQVSNLGRVKSLRRNEFVNDSFRKGNEHVNCFVRVRNEKILSPGLNTWHYLIVRLCKQGKMKTVTVHSLVAEAFIPIPEGLKQFRGTHHLQVNHKDENKLNNCVDNLEWCTPKYNVNYGTRTKRIADKRSIPIYQYTVNGELVKIWPSQMEASRNGYSQGCISVCLKDINKTHRGYKWSFKPLNKEGEPVQLTFDFS